MEEIFILNDQPRGAAERRQGEGPHVMAVDPHDPLLPSGQAGDGWHAWTSVVTRCTAARRLDTACDFGCMVSMNAGDGVRRVTCDGSPARGDGVTAHNFESVSGYEASDVGWLGRAGEVTLGSLTGEGTDAVHATPSVAPHSWI